MICKVEEAVEELKQGKMIIVIDDEDRENEGDFLMAASDATPEMVTFMAKVGKGLICTPVSPARAKQLDLPLMVENNTSSHTTAFTVSIDHKNCHTGISSLDRSMTIKAMIDETTKSEDFHKPGHIFPLIAKEKGVLERRGHTEATVDLVRMAGKGDVGVICEIMNDDGTMSRLPELLRLAKKYDLKILTIDDLVKYRSALESSEQNSGETGYEYH